MFGFSGSEFLLIIVVAVLAVGPKQLPEVLHAMGKLYRRLQYMRFAMSKQFEDFMEQADLKELRDQAKIIPPNYFDEAAVDEEFMMKPLSLDPSVHPQEEGSVRIVETETPVQDKNDDR